MNIEKKVHLYFHQRVFMVISESEFLRIMVFKYVCVELSFNVESMATAKKQQKTVLVPSGQRLLKDFVITTRSIQGYAAPVTLGLRRTLLEIRSDARLVKGSSALSAASGLTPSPARCAQLLTGLLSSSTPFAVHTDILYHALLCFASVICSIEAQILQFPC